MSLVEARITEYGNLFVRITDPPLSEHNLDRLMSVHGAKKQSLFGMIRFENIAGASTKRTLLGFEQGDFPDPPDEFVIAIAAHLGAEVVGSVVPYNPKTDTHFD